MQMRRSERALTGLNDITAVLDRCLIMRLGLVDDDGPYIVPVHFAYVVRDGRITVYAHGATQGRKYAAIAGRPQCCVEVDQLDGLFDGGTGACGLSGNYQSVIGFGVARIVDAQDEAHDAMAAIVARQKPEMVATVPSPLPDHVAIIAVDLDQVTGKARASLVGQPV